jgi:hypothetical protein
VDHGAKILNMSFGRIGPPSFVVENAIRSAVGRGAFVVVAAGNEYLNGNPVSVLAEICSRINGAVSVAAIDRNKQHASYSTAGSYVEIAAPGGDGSLSIDTFIVQQTYDFNFTDTYLRSPSHAPHLGSMCSLTSAMPASMATPHRRRGCHPDAAGHHQRRSSALKRTAVDLGAPGRIISSATAWSMCGPRCSGSEPPMEPRRSRSSCFPGRLPPRHKACSPATKALRPWRCARTSR